MKKFKCLECGQEVTSTEIHTYDDCLKYKQSHPAPTPDLLLTDEEIWMTFYQDGADPTKEGADVTDWMKTYDGAACKRIAQAQLSKINRNIK